jgi:hypothetical protein
MAKVEDPCACETSSDVTNEKRDQGEARPASRRPAPAAGKIVCSRAFARELERDGHRRHKVRWREERAELEG